jgi:threonine/homoserine/homoserine lactone efflux protein
VIDASLLPAYVVAVLLIALAPGPDMAYIVAAATAHGPRAGVLSAAGMALGMVVHVTATAVGLAALLAAVPVALDAIRLAGAAYLGWLAVDTLRSATGGGLTGHAAPSRGRLLRRATLTNLANPKVILFFAAFLPHFVRVDRGAVAGQLLLLGAVFLLVGLVVDSAIGLAAGQLRTALAPGSRAGRALTVLAGATFAVLAVLLVVDVVTAWRAAAR